MIIPDLGTQQKLIDKNEMRKKVLFYIKFKICAYKARLENVIQVKKLYTMY